MKMFCPMSGFARSINLSVINGTVVEFDAYSYDNGGTTVNMDDVRAVTIAAARDVYVKAKAVDLLCATVLIGKGRRESLVALVFCAMVGFYLLAKLFSCPIWTTYAIIEALAYLQCFVIGSGYVGNHDNDGASNMRLLSALDRLADWRNAAFASAVSGWGKRR